jgi:hypothetical protein
LEAKKSGEVRGAKLIGNIRQHAAQNLIPAPNLKASMHRFVVRIALGQHVQKQRLPRDCARADPIDSGKETNPTIMNIYKAEFVKLIR